MKLPNMICFLIIVLSCSAAPALCRASDGITAGEFIIEPPTLICLGFEWKITGDDNRNAEVAVSYREKGKTGWNKALPLLRIGGEIISD